MKILNVILGICVILMTAAIAPAAVYADVLPEIEAGPDVVVISGAYYVGVVTYTNPSRVAINISTNYGDGSRIETRTINAGGAASGSYGLFHQYRLPVGESEINFTLSVSFDYGSGIIVNDSLLIHVISPNLPPLIDPISDMTTDAGGIVTFNVVSEDLSHLPVVISASELPPGATLGPTGAISGTFKYKATFSWAPGWQDMGSHQVTFISTNTQSLTTSVQTMITVLTAPPTAITGGPYTIKVGEGVTLESTGSLIPYAANGCSYVFEWDIDNNGTFDVTGTTAVLSAADLAGYGVNVAGVEYHPVLRITDSLGQTSTAAATVAIVPQYTLTVNTLGDGAVTVDPSQEKYDAGMVVTITATPAENFHFSRWTGDATGTDNTVSITMDGNKTVNALFDITQYTVTVNTVGNGNVNLSLPGPVYDSGTVVTLIAIADSGFVFSHWEGAVTGTVNPLAVTVDGDKNITAVFIAQYTVDINIIGGGTVNVSPDQTVYLEGDVVTFTATPATGYIFDHWQGALAGNLNPADITINSNTTVTAVFVLQTFALIVDVSGEGTVTKSPDAAIYDYGTVVTLTANPAEGYDFIEWIGAVTGSVNPVDVTVDAAKTVTAVFSPKKVFYCRPSAIMGHI